MSILFVLENYYPKIGGVETLFKSLVDELIQKGYQCTVITTWPGKDIPRKEEMRGLRIVRIPVWSRYLFTLIALFPVLRYVRKCDLVHTTSYNAAIPAWIGAKLFRKPVIITFHEVWGKLWFELPFVNRISKIGHYLFEQLLLRLSFDQFIAPSHATAKSLEKAGINALRIRQIYPGIRYHDFETSGLQSKSVNAGRFTYTYFGRLGISKGLDLLLPAIDYVRNVIPQVQLRLIVPRSPRSVLKWIQDYVQDHNLEDNVSIRHNLLFKELKQTIRASDCVVIPSYSEGFCFVAVETIALGVPVISSGRTALKEVVSGKYLSMGEFTSKGLAEMMIRGYHGKWEFKPVKTFEIANTVKEYIAVYCSKMQQ